MKREVGLLKRLEKEEISDEGGLVPSPAPLSGYLPLQMGRPRFRASFYTPFSPVPPDSHKEKVQDRTPLQTPSAGGWEGARRASGPREAGCFPPPLSLLWTGISPRISVPADTDMCPQGAEPPATAELSPARLPASQPARAAACSHFSPSARQAARILLPPRCSASGFLPRPPSSSS